MNHNDGRPREKGGAMKSLLDGQGESQSLIERKRLPTHLLGPTRGSAQIGGLIHQYNDAQILQHYINTQQAGIDHSSLSREQRESNLPANFGALATSFAAAPIRTSALEDSNARWDDMFQGLLDYYTNSKSFNIPRSYKWHNRSLFEWARNQRKQFLNGLRGRKPLLQPQRIARLRSIGFDLNPTGVLGKNDAFEDKRWVTMFEGLAEYQRKHGHCVVPVGYNCDKRSLHDWVRQQRKQYSNSLEGVRPSLSSERTERLLSIGFDLDPTGRRKDKRTEQERWDAMFQGLVDYHKSNSTFVLPERFFHDGRSLFSWAHNQRRLYANYINGQTPTLAQERVDRLRAIGFIDARCREKKTSGKRRRPRSEESTSDSGSSFSSGRKHKSTQLESNSKSLSQNQRSTDAIEPTILRNNDTATWATSLAMEALAKYQRMADTCNNDLVTVP